MDESEFDSGRAQVKAITVRLDQTDYHQLRSYANMRNVSLNTVVNEAVAHYARRLARQTALERISAFHDSLDTCRDCGTDTVGGIRELRRERADQLAQGSSAAAPPQARGSDDAKRGCQV